MEKADTSQYFCVTPLDFDRVTLMLMINDARRGRSHVDTVCALHVSFLSSNQVRISLYRW